MSLTYFLTGNPQNRLEFDDMLQKKKVHSLDIIMGEKIYNSKTEGWFFYECYTILEAGNKKLSLIKESNKHQIDLGNYHGNSRKLKIQKRVFDEMVYLANYYRSRGINVTIAKREIEEAIKETEEYHRIEKSRLLSIK